MEPTPDLAARLDADRREAARSMTIEQRAEAPIMLFDMATEAMLAGLRMQNPDTTSEEIHRLFLQQMKDIWRYRRHSW